MVDDLIYISKGELYKVKGEKSVSLLCEAVEKYKRTIIEINQRKDWKTKGTGAMFMNGPFGVDERSEPIAKIADAVIVDQDSLVYAAVLENSTAIYKKSMDINEKNEELIVLKKDLIIYDIAYCKENSKFAASVGVGINERNIAIIDEETGNVQFITEGESWDCNPVFDPNDCNIIYYDSCGIAYEKNDNISGIGPKSILKLNMRTGDLEELLSEEKYDFFKPKFNMEGTMYYIKRPYKTINQSKFSFKNILLAPFIILKGILGWLDFFTKRYAGQSLITKGNNPTKLKQPTEEELFIEGNLINVKKSLEESKKIGNKYPGIAPSSWELTTLDISDKKIIMKKGVLDYDIAQSGDIVYSNGKCVIKIDKANHEEIICKTDLATKISII